jgi:Ser/Thr protein kinase RdoA (MazF antagonist)
VIPPSSEVDPGPHRHGGHIVTFWRYVEERGEIDARAAGRGLRMIHEALVDYDGPLPSAGRAEDVDAMLASFESSPDVELLRELAARGIADGGQVLHGDAHLFNCRASASGTLWHDFESSCRGPREYDLAALVERDRLTGGDPPAREALAAYGTHDAALLDALLPVYVAWICASFLVALPRRPTLRPILDEHLSRLREFVGAT